MIYPIIRKPRRRYPLPENRNDLKKPYLSPTLQTRSCRVDRDKEGYSEGEDPTREHIRSSKSTVVDSI